MNAEAEPRISVFLSPSPLPSSLFLSYFLFPAWSTRNTNAVTIRCCWSASQWYSQYYGLDQSVILFEVLLHRPCKLSARRRRGFRRGDTYQNTYRSPLISIACSPFDLRGAILLRINAFNTQSNFLSPTLSARFLRILQR